MEKKFGSYVFDSSEKIHETGIVQILQASSKGNKICVKIVNKTKDNQQIKQFYREKEIGKILQLNDHQNLIRFYDVQEQDDKLFFFMEMGNQNLATYMKKRNYNFEEKEIYDLLFQVSSGYLQLIELQIMHRDLKEENIIIKYDSNGKLIYKIIDFGSGKILEPQKMADRMQTSIQSSLNTSPEGITGKYDNRCDIYSLGLIVLKMYDYKLTQNFAHKQILDSIVKDNYDLNFFTRQDKIPVSIWNILASMICPFDKRMHWSQLNERSKQAIQPKRATPTKNPSFPQRDSTPDNTTQKNLITFPSQLKSQIKQPIQQTPIERRSLILQTKHNTDQTSDIKKDISLISQNPQTNQQSPIFPQKQVNPIRKDFEFGAPGRVLYNNQQTPLQILNNQQQYETFGYQQQNNPFSLKQSQTNPEIDEPKQQPSQILKNPQNTQIKKQNNFIQVQPQQINQQQHQAQPSFANNQTFQQNQFRQQFPQFNQFPPPTKPFPQWNK